MPISEEEFEAGEVNIAQRVLRLLSSYRDRAFSLEELLQAINYQPSLQIAKGPHEMLDLLGIQIAAGEQELLEALGILPRANLIQSKNIKEQTYYIVR